jgi:hypothetical protein
VGEKGKIIDYLNNMYGDGNKRWATTEDGMKLLNGVDATAGKHFKPMPMAMLGAGAADDTANQARSVTLYVYNKE